MLRPSWFQRKELKFHQWFYQFYDPSPSSSPIAIHSHPPPRIVQEEGFGYSPALLTLASLYESGYEPAIQQDSGQAARQKLADLETFSRMRSERFPFIVWGSGGWTLVRLQLLVASSWRRFRVVNSVSMGEAAKPRLFEGCQAGSHVVLRGRRGTLWPSNLFDNVSKMPKL